MKSRTKTRPAGILLGAGWVAGLLLVACQARIPPDALTLSPDTMADRRLQTRVFPTADEHKLLQASAALLQDLGYAIDDTEVPCGLIVSSRDRDVTRTGQVVGSIVLGALTGILIPWDKNQKVLASLVTRPLGEDRVAVRITFQHMVWNSNDVLVKNEQINDPEVYEEFFSKLSKAVFLEAHEI